MTLLELLLIGSIALIIAGAPTSRPPAGPSWFDIMPTLTQSKKQRTRLQQTRRHGTRRYGS